MIMTKRRLSRIVNEINKDLSPKLAISPKQISATQELKINSFNQKPENIILS